MITTRALALAARVRLNSPTTGSWAFDYVAALLGTWLVVGMYVDAWAHHHLFFETFFTPWHALLYSGAAANTAFLGLRAYRDRGLPTGYELSLAGCILFGMGGVADLAWHTAFGIERDFAAILSPTHLILMLSAGLIVSGPLRAAWRSRAARLSGIGAWSLTLTVAVVLFFMQNLNPLVAQWPNPNWAADQTNYITAPFTLRIGEMLGTVNMALATSVLVGSLLLAMRRFELRPGQVLVLTAVPAAALILTYKVDPIIVIPALAGLAGEILRIVMRPSPARTGHLRLFLVLLTGVLWALYMSGLAATDGTAWPIHSEFGVIVVSMIAAWLLTFLAFPPATPSVREHAGAPQQGNGRHQTDGWLHEWSWPPN